MSGELRLVAHGRSLILSEGTCGVWLRIKAFAEGSEVPTAWVETNVRPDNRDAGLWVGVEPNAVSFPVTGWESAQVDAWLDAHPHLFDISRAEG